MLDRRNKSPALCNDPGAPCTLIEFYAIGVPLAGLLGAIGAVLLSWL